MSTNAYARNVVGPYPEKRQLVKILFTDATRPIIVEDLLDDGEIVRIPHSFTYDFSSPIMEWKEPLTIFGMID